MGVNIGPDLDFVSRHCGLTQAEVIALHSAGEYPVYMMGFTPGFPYLGGMDRRLACPRLETPRTRIPAGSVGIAGEQTGIYPLESPGGWRIIGRTPLRLFDLQREPPCLLAPGDMVRFVSIERMPDDSRAPMSPMAFRIIDPGGPLTTVQDLGRFAMERFGVPAAGAMDWFALQAANRLVGNPPGAAVLEFAFQGPRLAADRDCLVCVTGGGFHPRVGKRDLPWLDGSICACR